MSKNIIWWIIELIIWYCFAYLVLFAIKNQVHIGWTAFIIVILASLGLFASPLTRHLSIWNKILDQVVKKEEEKQKY